MRGMEIGLGDKVKFFPGDSVWTVVGINVGGVDPEMLLVENGRRRLELLARNIHSLVESACKSTS